MATHSSTLVWRIPWMEEPGRLPSMGSHTVGHDWVTSLSLFTFHFHALEKKMATHSSVLAWRIPGIGEPGGLQSIGLHRVGHDWSDLVVAAENSARVWKDFPKSTQQILLMDLMKGVADSLQTRPWFFTLSASPSPFHFEASSASVSGLDHLPGSGQ